MFAGKTEELLRRVRRAVIAGRRVVVIGHALDTRHGADRVASHIGVDFPALPVRFDGIQACHGHAAALVTMQGSAMLERNGRPEGDEDGEAQRCDGTHLTSVGRDGPFSLQASSKKPCDSTKSGRYLKLLPGFVVSTTAQSGSFGDCMALFA